MTDMTVIVTGGRISAVAKAGELRTPAGAKVIDASGKFMIPGLWDMHAHWNDRDFLPLFLANGVTGVRIMRGVPVHQDWRKSVEDGTLLAPRMVIASNLLDGPNPLWPFAIVVHDEAEARTAVRKSKMEGADFIKVYSLLSRESFFAIADETKKQGLPFAGHVPVSVSAAEASDAGQKSVEHLDGVLEAASSRDEEMRKIIADAASNRPQGAQLDPEVIRRVSRTYRETFSKERIHTLLQQFKRNQTWQTPTLTLLRGQAFLDGERLRNDPRLKYMPLAIRAEWKTTTDSYGQRTSEDVDLSGWRWQKYLEVVAMMGRLGVPILAGTDARNPYCLPGFSLHDELALLVQAGLTPAAALRTATISPAVFLGREQDLGTIAKGKLADLVLLDANPLKDIANTTRINAVVVNGRLLERKALNNMLNQVEAVASR
jgi:imidazolonepropionase-like amidohydrolase